MACSIRSPIDALAVALLLVSAAPSWAGKAEADAKAAANKGKSAYQLGHFDEALKHYEKAWAAKPVPGLLFNLGQCHRNLGHTDQALHYFRQYLESGPPATQAKATRELVAKLEEQAVEAKRREQAAAEQQRALEMEQARAEAARAEAARVEAEKARDQTHLAELEAERAAEATRRRELEAALVSAEAAPKAEQTPVYKRWWFWTGIGVVAAGAAVGIAVAASPHAPPTTYPDINAR